MKLHSVCTATAANATTQLQYVALSNLPVSIYQVTYQLKILTTCLFSILFFGRTYSMGKWISLILLTVGVAIVQGNDSAPALPKDSPNGNPTLGLLAILAACTSSGIAGCYFE